ncbi:hypothetical protein JIQ42_07642 [Leishmania sp. Namibia]|uniref:hypothetical protein n=1 Tax=Leishmania sp. Namibia TaxID=2802991 RepID=UPI001B50DDC0|nr:hypothetical protein JIQ42_07642 [Leishmania sp. Namibia]
MQTFYDVLNVPMSASQGELQHAYRRLLTRLHPDRCYHDNDSVSYNTTRELDQVRMNLLQRAHKVLCNPQERSEYDAYLTRQLQNESTAHHEPPQQACRLQGMAAPQVLAFVGSAHGSAGGTGGMVNTLTDLAEVNGNNAPSTIGSRSVARPPTAAFEGVCDGAANPQYPNPMTRALGTSLGAADVTATRQEGAAVFPKSQSANTPPSGPIVYTAPAATQRRPDDAVSVCAIKTGPHAVGLVVVTNESVASGALASGTAAEASQQQQQQQGQPSATMATALPFTESDIHLPRRIRVIEEHLVIRV